MACLICGEQRTDICHIRSRGSGGTTDEFNLMELCRRHHREQHQIGWHRFSIVHPIIAMELKEKGWDFVFEFGIPKLRREKGILC